MKDNHYGPKFEEVKNQYPTAKRFHWHVNAFSNDPNERYWMVGFTAEFGGGAGIVWKDIRLSEIQ